MSTSFFQVTEHVIPCQHIREYPHAIKSNRDVLRLAIKEYKPLNNIEASPGDITIIATHANGIPKECYEPLWDDLFQMLSLKIRAIWIADCSHQGASGVLNEHLQGDDPSWFDHSRDLLCMINHFKESMHQPVVGIGHSMGSAQLVQLSLIHPRLFCTLALNEPIIQNVPPSGPNAAYLTSHRSDLWASREKAQASFRNSPFFKTWDQRAFGLFLQHGLRDTPSAVYPKATAGAVTLTTTKHQEAWSYVRSNFTAQSTDLQDQTERLVSPDMDPDKEGSYLFHRAEPCLALQSLPHIRPGVLWIFGAKSPINTPASQVEKVAMTGTGVGGSGGTKAERVEKIVLDAGHMAPLERVKETAETLAHWLEKEVGRFKQEETFYRNYNSGKSERDMLVVSKQWMAGVRHKANTKRPVKSSL